MAVGSNEPVVGASEACQARGQGPRPGAHAWPQDDGERDPARGAGPGTGKEQTWLPVSPPRGRFPPLGIMLRMTLPTAREGITQ